MCCPPHLILSSLTNMLCLLSSFALIALTIAKPSPAGLTFEVQRNVHARPRPYLRLASALGLQQPVYSHNYISYGLSFAVGSPAKIYHTVLDTGLCH
ncbi:uncharacterized protein L969DRAFT_88448 [Mixia osmundae IAM 14324]|uniref:uncharacterized protein n=1 Tax=Mixia osmundae (strain CBS 9802 / IAM 14324 / JCM 22182 / KY 12970) TaxID=764103 RepID=UPI0004A549E5|nr:uncharacterized protein L969DRAFT_88448 [Mixia osmundae IAM 14324]KEI39038.1 hypothetical protein L969DRAFT_88448 [Mixia osmundae IAM 14324]